MKLEQIKKNIKYGDYNILQKLLKTSSVSVAKRKFLSGDKEALDAMMVIQENRTIFPYLHDELYEFDGLVQALKNKADLNHRHDISDINNLSAVLDKVEYLYIDSERKVNVDGSNASGNLKDAVDNRHSHSNKIVLDNLKQKVIDDSHTHTNKALLDTYNQTNANISDAVSLKHTHTNKNVLDGVSAAKVSNWDAASVNTHAHANKTVLDNLTQSVIDNNHSHTNKALLDSYNQTNANVTDAVNLKHNHSNKVVLDAITEAFKTADKKLLDALGGLQFESDQANAILKIKDGNGSLLTSISLAYLNNEGTKFTYNTTGKMLELRNDADDLLSSIPVSSFVTNLMSQANWNGITPTRLDFKDNAGVVLFSVDYSMSNINGLVTELNKKVDTIAGKQLSTEDYTTTEKNKLANIQAGAEVNVNADWNATTGDAAILNKPSVFSPSTHTHPISDIANLQTELNNKANTSGSYPNITSGNSLKFGGRGYTDSNPMDFDRFMVFDPYTTDTWRPATVLQTQDKLGINNKADITYVNSMVSNFFEKESVVTSLNVNHYDLGLFTVIPTTLNLPEKSYGIIYAYKTNTTWWFQQFKSTNGTIWERRAINPQNIDDWQSWVKTNSNISIDNYIYSFGDNMTGDLGLMNNAKFKLGWSNDPTHYIWKNPSTDFDEINISTGFEVSQYSASGNTTLLRVQTGMTALHTSLWVDGLITGNGFYSDMLVTTNKQIIQPSGSGIYFGNPQIGALNFESIADLIHYKNGISGTVWSSHNFNPNTKADVSYVDNKVASIPTPNNGTFTVQGIGDLIGSGATTANASTNSVANLDLSTITKNRIQLGVNAYNIINSSGFGGNVRNYDFNNPINNDRFESQNITNKSPLDCLEVVCYNPMSQSWEEVVQGNQINQFALGLIGLIDTVHSGGVVTKGIVEINCDLSGYLNTEAVYACLTFTYGGGGATLWGDLQFLTNQQIIQNRYNVGTEYKGVIIIGIITDPYKIYVNQREF